MTKGKIKSWFCCVNFKIYLARSLMTWSDRTWDFAMSLFLIHLSPESFQLTAIYSFISRGSVLVFGPAMGDWIDRTGRLKAIRVLLFSQNILAIICSATIIVVLQNKNEMYWVNSSIIHTVSKVLIVTLAGLVRLATLGSILCIEKDWIVVFANGNKTKLANLNAALRQIDLGTGIIAPLLVGQILTFSSELVMSIFFIAWFIVALFIEFYLIWKIYNLIPPLAEKSTEAFVLKQHSSNNKSKCFYLQCILLRLKPIFSGWYLFWKQKVFLAGFGLSLLYITVLGFDGITTVFAHSQGLSESIVSVLMATASLVGIISSCAFPPIRKRFGLPLGGVLALSLQVSCLTLCVGSIWIPGSPFNPKEFDTLSFAEAVNKPTTYMLPNVTSKSYKEMASIIVFMSGVVSSRFGLWLADLSISQMYQEYVVESERGLLNSIQNSLNMIMALTKYSLVICIPKLSSFGIHILISFSCIVLALICMIVYYCKHAKKSEENQMELSIQLKETEV